MICEHCQESKTKILETREQFDPKGFHYVERRHRCYGCDFKFVTIELERGIFGALINNEHDTD